MTHYDKKNTRSKRKLHSPTELYLKFYKEVIVGKAFKLQIDL
jgi:hypothetical protein